MNKWGFPKLWSIVFRNFYCARIPSLNHLSPSLIKINKFPWTSQVFGRSLLAVIPAVFALKSQDSKKEKENAAKTLVIIKTADELYSKLQYEELYTFLLDEEKNDNAEILWRLARATYEKSRIEKTDEEKLKYLERALDYVNKALEMNDGCSAAHKWKAILLDSVWRYKSIKGRLVQSFEVRKHMERAIELNPKDATSYYILGEWCFTFADLPWYQRKTASVLFTSPPNSTYEEAYTYFEKAEEAEPGFYSMNWLMLAKCLLKVNEKEKAIEYLLKTKDYPIVTLDDKQAHEEAVLMLNKLGVK